MTKKVPLNTLATETETFCQNLASKASNILFPIKIILNKMHIKDLEYDFNLERK